MLQTNFIGHIFQDYALELIQLLVINDCSEDLLFLDELQSLLRRFHPLSRVIHNTHRQFVFPCLSYILSFFGGVVSEFLRSYSKFKTLDMTAVLAMHVPTLLSLIFLYSSILTTLPNKPMFAYLFFLFF
jgi:hypothetical protein